MKPCPFCGKPGPILYTNREEAEFLDQRTPTVLQLQRVCDANAGGCGASTAWEDTEALADAAWERRVGEDPEETYAEMLTRKGMDSELAHQMMLRAYEGKDLAPLPMELDLFDSPLHGKGVCPCFALSSGSAWPAGFNMLTRYLNHSRKPNVRLETGMSGHRWVLMRRVDRGEELLCDYEQAMKEIMGL